MVFHSISDIEGYFTGFRHKLNSTYLQFGVVD